MVANFFPPNMSQGDEKMFTIAEAKEMLGFTGLENQPRQL
jgi:hypothetical protein